MRRRLKAVCWLEIYRIHRKIEVKADQIKEKYHKDTDVEKILRQKARPKRNYLAFARFALQILLTLELKVNILAV